MADAGAAADRVAFALSGNPTIARGSGAETRFRNGVNGEATATGFATGAGGKVLDPDHFSGCQRVGWEGNPIPFGAGDMQPVQDGADRLLQIEPPRSRRWHAAQRSAPLARRQRPRATRHGQAGDRAGWLAECPLLPAWSCGSPCPAPAPVQQAIGAWKGVVAVREASPDISRS